MNSSEKIQTDGVAKTLIISLLLVIVGCWATILSATYRTDQEAPPLPKIIMSERRQTIKRLQDIVQGKAGFQKADLMDYGSIYGMGSYLGENYTAQYLVELGQ